MDVFFPLNGVWEGQKKKSVKYRPYWLKFAPDMASRASRMQNFSQIVRFFRKWGFDFDYAKQLEKEKYSSRPGNPTRAGEWTHPKG